MPIKKNNDVSLSFTACMFSTYIGERDYEQTTLTYTGGRAEYKKSMIKINEVYS